MNLLVSGKVFENKGAILRPFSARDVETESRMAGRELGLSNFTPGFQRALLQREFLLMMRDKLCALPFTCARTNDVLDLYLVLTGVKPASILDFGKTSLSLSSPTCIQFGKYAPIYAKVSDSVRGTEVLVISRDLSLVAMLNVLLAEAKSGKASPEYFRSQGAALGYPPEAVDAFAPGPAGRCRSQEYIASLLEDNILLSAPIWNSSFVPAIKNGKVLEVHKMEFWNSVLAKELGSAYFSIASASNKMWKIELLLASLKGNKEWPEETSERLIREAVERAYGVPLSVGY
jgi:hypothetical protein